jgi:hypothetical protein
MVLQRAQAHKIRAEAAPMNLKHADRFVPKVHPTTREVESDDPLELVAEPVPGDPDVMLECLVQEFAWLGWDVDPVLGLFHSPDYPVLNQLLDYFGEAEVRRRIGAILGGVGVFRVTETIDDEPDPEDDDGPELIQLTIRKSGAD